MSAECGLPAFSWVKTDNPVRRSNLPGDPAPIAIYEHTVDGPRSRAYDAHLAALDRQRAIEVRLKRENSQGTIKEEPGSSATITQPPIFNAQSQQWTSRSEVATDNSFQGSQYGPYHPQSTGWRPSDYAPDVYSKLCGCQVGPCVHGY
jgi:hypothetical protein